MAARRIETAEAHFDIRDELLADLAEKQRDSLVCLWVQAVRDQHIGQYAGMTEEQLRTQFAPTVDWMIVLLRTGEIAASEGYMRDLILRRMTQGYLLVDIERSMHALQDIVLRLVRAQIDDSDEKLHASYAISELHDMVVLSVASAYQQLQDEEQRRFLEVYEFGETLSRSLDLREVLDTGVWRLSENMRASSAAVLLHSKDDRRSESAMVRMMPDLAEAVPAICDALGCGPEYVEVLNARAAACLVPEVGKVEQLAAWHELLSRAGYTSLACVPLITAEHVLGTAIMFMAERREFRSSDADYLLALVGHIASAVENALLFDEARGKRDLNLLLSAVKLFGSSLEMKEVLRQAAMRSAESIGADYSFVLLPDFSGTRLHIAAFSGAADVSESVIEGIMARVEPTGIGMGQGASGRVFTTGEPMLIPVYSDYPDRIPQLVDVTGSMALVPMKLRGVVTGVFSLVSFSPGKFADADLSLARAIADQAAIALENARLYERQRNIAETLQQSLLPAQMPHVAGYEFSAIYRAALAEAEVGGDFYDAFELTGGGVAFLIADVSGKGVCAARYTAAGKYMLRAFASEDPDPARAMRLLNSSLMQYMPVGTFITMFFGVLDRTTNLIVYANAGHDQPFLYRSAGGGLTNLDVTGPGLAIVAGASYETRRITIDPGDCLLLYTDGATDVRRDSLLLSPAGLERIFLSLAGKEAHEVCDRAFEQVLDYGRGRLADDVALMVIRRSP